MSELKKIIDEREALKQNKNKDRKRTRGAEALVKGWELNNFLVQLS